MRAERSALPAFLLALLAAGPVLGQEDEKSELEKKIDGARVEFQFLSTPFPRVAEYLSRVSGVPIRLSTRVPAEARVTFRGKDMPLRRALHWTTYLAGLDYHVGEEAVLVAPWAEIAARRSVLRTFDVRDLTLGASDSPGPDLTLEGEEADTGLGVGFGADVVGEEPLSAQLLQTLIENDFAPGSWDPPHGISVRQGVLFVRHIPEVLDRISRFLDELRRMSSALVTVEGRFLSVSPADWDRFFRQAGGPDARTILTAQEWDALRREIEASADVRRLAFLRTTSAPGQQVHAISEEYRTIVADYDVQIAQGSGVADPIVRMLRGGAMIEVRPIPSAGGESVTLDLSARMLDLDVSRSLPYGPEDPRAATESVPPIELPRGDALVLDTKVRIPDRGAYVATFVNPLAGEARDRRVVLVVEPRIERAEGE